MARDRVIVASLDGCKGYVEPDGTVLIGKCMHQTRPHWGRLTDERCRDCPFARFTLVPVVKTEELYTSSAIGHG